MNACTFACTLDGVDLSCEIEFEAAEKRTFDEPGWPASATLHSASVGGVNVYALLDDGQVDEIEASFLNQKEEY